MPTVDQMLTVAPNQSDMSTSPVQHNQVEPLDFGTAVPEVHYTDQQWWDNFAQQPASQTAQLQPEKFDWDSNNASKFVNSPHSRQVGFDPALGDKEQENKYQQYQTGWDETKRMVGGFVAGMGHGFYDMAANWKNIGSALSNPTLADAFKQDQLEEVNRKQQEFDNNYHIFQGDNPTWYSSVAKGIQASGHFLGALGEIAAETMAIQAVVAATGGLGSGLEGAEAAKLSARLGADTIPELTKNTANIVDAINNPGVIGNAWKSVGEFAQQAGKVLPGVGNTLGYTGALISDGATGGAIATMARGFGAFANDLRSINVATGFASSNAAATYQQIVNDQTEKFRQQNGGAEPGYADLQDIQDKAMKAAKVDGAINAYGMLFLEKAAFGNLLNSRATLQEAVNNSGRGIYDRVGVKPWWVEGADAEPLYIKQQAKWNNFKANLTNNYYEGARHILAKGAEFGVFGNVMDGIDKGVKSYFDARYDNKDISEFDAFRNGISSQFTKEGGKTFISGFLQGALLLGIGGAALGRVKDWAADKASSTDTQIKQLQQSAQLNAEAVKFADDVNALWKDPLNPVKGTVHDMVIQNAMGESAKDALAGNDRKEYHDIQDDQSRLFLLKMIKNGLADMWVKRAQEESRTLSQDDLCKMMGVESTPENYQSIKDEIDQLPQRTKELKRISREVDTKLGNPFNPWAKDPMTGKRLFTDGTVQFQAEYNNWKIHQIAKDYTVIMKDSAQRALERQGELLNGKNGTTGILDMPFAKNLDFSSLFTTTSPELLDKHIQMYNDILDASPDHKDKGAEIGLKLTQKYKESLTEYLTEYADILNEGASADRTEKLQKLNEKHKETLTKDLHTYLENSVMLRNLNGKVVDKRTPPELNEVRDGMDKMMDYYQLGVDHHALLHQLNLILDPSIIRKFQMSFMKEGAKRQHEAQEEPVTETTTKTPDNSGFEEAEEVPDTEQKPVPVPTPEPVDTRAQDNIRSNIREWITEDKNLSAEANKYLNEDKTGLKQILQAAEGIYMDDENTKSKAQFLKEIDEILNKHFDKDVAPFDYSHLPDKPKVEGTGPYTVSGIAKKFDSIREANQALQEKYPKFEISGREFQVGQHLYDDNGKQYLLKDRDVLIPTSGKSPKLIQATGDTLLQYHDQKPDTKPGAVPIPEARLQNINEIVEVHPPGFTEAEMAANQVLIDKVLSGIPKGEVSDQLSVVVSSNPERSDTTYDNALTKDNPYITINREPNTIAIYRNGKDKPMLYITHPGKYTFTFDGVQYSVPPKDKFELVYDLHGQPLDEVYGKWVDNYNKSQQLAEVIDHIKQQNGGVLTGANLDKYMALSVTNGGYDFIPRSEADKRPTVQDTIDSGKELFVVVDQVHGDVVYGTKHANAVLPKQPNELGGYIAGFLLDNGQMRWAQMVAPEYTPEELSELIADWVTKASGDIRKLNSDGDLEGAQTLAKLATDKLKNIFITQPPKSVSDNVVSFKFSVSNKGDINVGYRISTKTDTGWVENAKHHIVINSGVGITKPATGMEFIQSLETKTNNYFRKQGLPEIAIKPENVRKGYSRDENKKIPKDLVMQSRITTSTDIIKDQKINYTVNKSALYRDTVPDSANVPRETSPVQELGVVVPATIDDVQKGQLADIGYTPVQSEEAQIQNLIDTHGDDVAAIRKSVRDSAKKLLPSGVQLSAHDIVTIHEFDKWMSDNLPDWIQRGELVSRLINGHVTAGEFVTSARTIYTSENSPFKYHEAFHSVYRTLLTTPQQRALLDEAERHAPVTTKEFEKFQDAYGHDKTRDDYYEEWMADKFDSWKADHKTDVPDGIRGWFQRLWNMLKELFKRLTGNQIEAMFYKMDRAGYKHAKLQDNEFTQTDTVNDSALKLIQVGTEEYIAPDGTKQSIPKYLSQEEGQRLSNTIAALYHMDSLTNTGSKRQVIEAILDNYRDTLDPVQPRYDEQFTQRYKADPVEAIRWDKKLNEQYNLFNRKESRESLIEAIDEHLKLMGYKQDINDAEISRAENEVGAKNYDTNADEIGGYDALALPIREYIGSTVVPYIDEFGNSQMATGQPVYQAVDGARVYNGLTQLLKNIPDLNDVVDKLVKAQYHGDTGAVIRRLISDTGFTIDDQNQWTISKNSQLFIQFLNGFRQASVNHIFVEAGTEGGVVGSTTRAYEANRRSVDRNQTDQWAVSFDTMYQQGYNNAGGEKGKHTAVAKTRYTQEHLKAWNTLREYILDKQGSYADDNAFVQNAQSISNDIKEQLGIAIHPLYIQYSIASTQEEPREYMTELLSTYKATPIAVDDLEGIRTVLTKGNNPFTEAINRLRNIATGNAVFDDTVDSTNYTNAENKNIYGFQQFNYILEQGVKMNSDAEIERLKSNPDTEMCHLLTDDKWLNWDKQVSVVDGIALRYHEANDKGELDTPAYLETNQSEGSSMKHFNVRELEYYRFSIYQAAEKVNGVYGTNVIPAIISDKSRLYMVNVPVIASVYHNKENRLKISDGAMVKLYNIVQEETERIQRVQKEIDSWATDEEKQFNHINDWHNGKLDGLKYNRAKQMLGDLLNPDGTVKEGTNMKQFPVQNQIEKYFLNKGGAIDKYLSELVEEGVIAKSDTGYTNKLLPGYLWEGISGEKGDGLNLKSDFKHNIAQIHISNFINADSYTHLLSPNGITTKRTSFWNADGPGVAKPNIIAPELGIDTPFTDIHVAILNDYKDEDGFEYTDSASYMTSFGARRWHFGTGSLTQTMADAIDKIENGKVLSQNEVLGSNGLLKTGNMLNPWKPVFYDGYTGLKTATMVLTKEHVMVKGDNGKWVPDVRRMELYHIWKQMTDHEQRTKQPAIVTFTSASKLQTKNVAKSAEELSGNHFTKLDANYLRKQLNNVEKGVHMMTKATQPIWNITAEQNDDTQVFGTTIGKIRKQYSEVDSERLLQNWNNALNGLFEIAGDKPLELSSTTDLDKITPTLGKFYDQMREQLQATGANEQTLGFLETRNGEPVYPALDFPATLEKYTQQVLNYFGKVMSEKVPGIDATDLSSWGHNVLREIHEVDDNGSPVPGKWRVIPDAEYAKEPWKFTDAIRYTDSKSRTHTGLKPGDIIIDHLRANVPQFDESGNATGLYLSEILAPIAHIGDTGTIDSPVAISNDNRIPYDSIHSGSATLRVGTLPMYLGSVVVHSSAVTRAKGGDFDYDKSKRHIFDTYSDGEKLHKYGEASTDSGKFREYLQYQQDNNKQLRSTVKELYKADGDLKDWVDNVIAKQKNIHGELIQQIIDINRLLSDTIPEGEIVSNIGITDSDEKYIYGNEKVGYREGTKNHISNILLQHKNYNDLYTQTKRELKSAFRESSDELSDLIKSFRYMKDLLIIKALQQLKLPSTVQEFIERGGENLNVGVLNNRELESKIALAGNSHVAGGENPINMETTSTKLLSDLISRKDGNSLYNIFERRLTEDANLTPEGRKRIEDLLKSFEISDVNINEMNGQSYTASVIWTGKNSVGVAANGVPVLSFVTQYDIPVSSDYIRFMGVDYNNLSSTTTQNGTRKFDVMMTYINTMTDNAKLDGLAAKLGLTREALSDAMSMNQAGMNIDDVILYMLQPAVRKYYNAITYIQGTLKSFEEERTFKNKILQDAIDSYEGNRPIELNREDLEEGVIYMYDDIQLSALLDIQKASKTGESLFNLSNVLGLAGGLPASWEEVDGIKEALEKLGIVNGKLVQDYTGVIDMRHALMTDPITSRYIQMLTQIDKLSPLLFMERSELYKRAMEIYSANLRTIRKSEKVKVTKERKQDLISYLTIANLIQELTGKGDITTLDSMDNALIYESLNGEHITDVVDRLNATLTGKKSNYFISQFIRPQKATDISNKSRINKLDSNNWAKLSDQRQIQIRDSFMQLATNPTTRADAMKLFNYLLVKDGGQFKSGSFIKYVAPAMFKDLLDSTAKVKRSLALKQYSDIDALELFGKDWNSVMNDYVKASGTHIDNKQYLKYIRVPVLDTKSYKPEQLEQLGFTVSGKPGKEIIEFPYTYRNGDSIYQLQTVFKADGKLITDKEHETIAKGSRAIYAPTQTTGARNTYKAAGALFGPVPLTKDLIQKQPVPQTAIQLPYSPDSKVQPKEVTIQPQTDIAHVNDNQEAIKQLAQKHKIFVANEGGRNVARRLDGTVYPVPAGVTPPQLLEQLNNPDTGHEIGEELDDDTIIELARKRDQKAITSQQPVVPSRSMQTGVKKVISGGQTGVDMAGLDAAIEAGIPTGGTAAHKFTQSTGPKSSDKISNQELATKYGLKEGQVTRKQGQYGPYDDVYTQRTVANAQEADGTIWFGNADSPGGKLTLGTTAQKGKPRPLVNPQSADEIRNWIALNRIETLNVAGNREHTNPGIYDKSKNMLIEALGGKRQQSVVPSQTDWKSTIDQIAKDKGLTGDNKDKWLDKARDVYKALNGRVPDSEIIDQIKSCI